MWPVFIFEITQNMELFMAWRHHYNQCVTLIDADIIAYDDAKKYI